MYSTDIRLNEVPIPKDSLQFQPRKRKRSYCAEDGIACGIGNGNSKKLRCEIISPNQNFDKHQRIEIAGNISGRKNNFSSGMYTSIETLRLQAPIEQFDISKMEGSSLFPLSNNPHFWSFFQKTQTVRHNHFLLISFF